VVSNCTGAHDRQRNNAPESTWVSVKTARNVLTTLVGTWPVTSRGQKRLTHCSLMSTSVSRSDSEPSVRVRRAQRLSTL
jgi:hypothetical protein